MLRCLEPTDILYPTRLAGVTPCILRPTASAHAQRLKAAPTHAPHPISGLRTRSRRGAESRSRASTSAPRCDVHRTPPRPHSGLPTTTRTGAESRSRAAASAPWCDVRAVVRFRPAVRRPRGGSRPTPPHSTHIQDCALRREVVPSPDLGRWHPLRSATLTAPGAAPRSGLHTTTLTVPSPDLGQQRPLRGATSGQWCDVRTVVRRAPRTATAPPHIRDSAPGADVVPSPDLGPTLSGSWCAVRILPQCPDPAAPQHRRAQTDPSPPLRQPPRLEPAALEQASLEQPTLAPRDRPPLERPEHERVQHRQHDQREHGR